ncbi:MAG: glycoside hydrolase family 13 protein, partial [Eubacterium sp.]
YYGDEAGNQGFEDPYNRGTYPWGHEDKELLEWYQEITNLRSKHKVFQNGAWFPFITEDNIFAYIRYAQDEYYLCIFNRSINSVHPFNHEILKNRQGFNLFTHMNENLESIVLNPLSYKILKISHIK